MDSGSRKIDVNMSVRFVHINRLLYIQEVTNGCRRSYYVRVWLYTGCFCMFVCVCVFEHYGNTTYDT